MCMLTVLSAVSKSQSVRNETNTKKAMKALNRSPELRYYDATPGIKSQILVVYSQS